MKAVCTPSSLARPLRLRQCGARVPLGLHTTPLTRFHNRRNAGVVAAAAEGATGALAADLQILAQEIVARAESVDNAAAQFVLHQPLISIPIAALFVALSPKLIQEASKRIGAPVVAALVGWLFLTHPSALVTGLTNASTFVETEPVTCSVLVFSIAALLIAPYLTMGAGTAASAWLVALMVQQEGWVPEQWAPAAVPLRTIQTKWEVAAQEAQQRGVAAPPSIQTPDLSSIKLPDLPNIPVPQLPNIPVPQLPASPSLPSWDFSAVQNLEAPKVFAGMTAPDLSGIKPLELPGSMGGLNLTAIKGFFPTLSLPVTLQDLPWTLPFSTKTYTLPQMPAMPAMPQMPWKTAAPAAPPAPAAPVAPAVKIAPAPPAPVVEAPTAAVPEADAPSVAAPPAAPAAVAPPAAPSPAAPALPEPVVAPIPEPVAEVIPEPVSIPEPVAEVPEASEATAPAVEASTEPSTAAAEVAETASPAAEAPTESAVDVVALFETPSAAESPAESAVDVVALFETPAVAAEAPAEAEIPASIAE